MAGGRAAGVTLTDGRSFAADKAVIANVGPALVFGKLLPGGSGNASVGAKMRAFRPGPGTMMVHFALGALPHWAAGEALQRFAYVHIAPDLAMMGRAYAEAMAGLLPGEPVLVVGQPTAIDPSRAPPGKHILWVQVRVLPAEIKGDAKGEIASGDWDKVKERYAARAVALLHQAFDRYARDLASETRAEWAKVQGRFEDVAFLDAPGEILRLAVPGRKLPIGL